MNDAFFNFIMAELFFQQVKQTKAINFDEPCIIYTFWNHFRTLAFALHLDEYPNIKLISRAHAYDLYNERKPTGRQPFKTFMNRKVNGLFFIAQKGLDYYLNNFAKDIASAKLYYSPLGIKQIKTVPFQNKLNKFHLVSCSNVIPLKRVELIIKALSLCSDKCNIHWTHFGDGSSMSEVKKFADDLLKNKINITYWFMGHVANEEVMKYYSFIDCSCFITTSSTEGLPVSIQEALSFGIPIIGTDVGGINEEIDGNGILLSPNPSPEEVASAITKVYKMNGKQLDRWKKRSYQIWEEKFNIEKNARRFLGILKNI